MNDPTQTPNPMPVIDMEALRAALFAWPFSGLRDALVASGIDPNPVEALLKADISYALMVGQWLIDRVPADAGELDG